MTQKITLPVTSSLAELAMVQQPPLFSLYQSTNRHHPENQQDLIRFRNLVKELETSLRKKYPVVEARIFLESLETLAQDHDFWNHTLDGLAVFGGSGVFRVFLLQRPVPELAIVADSFHTKPLRRFLQSPTAVRRKWRNAEAYGHGQADRAQAVYRQARPGHAGDPELDVGHQ